MKLTADNVAMVAKIITGHNHKPVYREGFQIIANEHEWLWSWSPDFQGSPADRDQALAVVEWLFAWLFNPERDLQQWNYRDLAVAIGDAINKKDITALQLMVLQLKERG